MDKNKDHKDKYAYFAALLSREGDADDKARWLEAMSDDDKAVFDILRRIRLDCDHELCSSQKSAVRASTCDKAFAQPAPAGRSGAILPAARVLLSVVACLTLVVGMGVWLLASSTFASDSTSAAESMVTFASTEALSTVTLPDGTTVALNKGSRLSYVPSDFSRGVRNVRLRGEALFDVTPDSAHAFVVASDGRLKVRVLGTRFNVRDYSDEDQLVVSLISGSVCIDDDNDRLVCSLEPLREAVFNKSSNTMKIERFDSTLVAGWTKGELRFRRTSFPELCKAIERKYHCKVVVQDTTINDRIVTGMVSDKESLLDILDILKISFSLNYKIEDKVITIY